MKLTEDQRFTDSKRWELTPVLSLQTAAGVRGSVVSDITVNSGEMKGKVEN